MTKPRILVVDDQDMVREAVGGILAVSGFTVRLASDPASAEAIFAAELIDASLLDVDLAGRSGVELCGALKRHADAVGHPFRAMMMTGVLRPELHEAARAAGAMGVLGKPFTMAELVRQVGAMVRSMPLSSAA